MAKKNEFAPINGWEQGFDSSVFDMFSTQEQRDSEKIGKLKEVYLTELVPFKEHTFKVKDDDEMTKLMESISERGVCNPLIVFENEDQELEIVSGHRRYRACELLGIDSVPVLQKKMTRDEAIIAMAEANLTSRENILPSEKGYSYRAMYEAMMRQQGERTDLTYVPGGHKLNGKSTRDILAEQIGVANGQITRYIRITYLIPELLEYVDEGKMGLKPAVEISYLPENYQKCIYEYCDAEEITPSHAQALELKKLYQKHKLSEDVITDLLSQEKPNQKEGYKISSKYVDKYMANAVNDREKVNRIILALKLLDAYEKGDDLDKIANEAEKEI